MMLQDEQKKTRRPEQKARAAERHEKRKERQKVCSCLFVFFGAKFGLIMLLCLFVVIYVFFLF